VASTTTRGPLRPDLATLEPLPEWASRRSRRPLRRSIRSKVCTLASATAYTERRASLAAGSVDIKDEWLSKTALIQTSRGPARPGFPCNRFPSSRRRSGTFAGTSRCTVCETIEASVVWRTASIRSLSSVCNACSRATVRDAGA